MKRLLLLAALLASPLTAEEATTFEATSTTGEKVRFPQDYKGKIVLLDFWATWCGPCIADLPNLSKVYADLKQKGFEVLGISLDSEGTEGRLAQFTKDHGMTWLQICDGMGWETELAKLYAVHSIPACFLVNGTTGQILAKGAELRGAALRAAVEKALGLPVSNTPVVKALMPTAAPVMPDPLFSKAAAAIKRSDFLKNEAVVEQLKHPRPGRITLSPPATSPLSSREVAKLARASHLRAGWYYRCTKCDKVHLNLAGAYAIAPDVAVTANHVLEPPATMKEGWLILVNEKEEFFTATAVLAANPAMDAALLRVAGGGLKALPVRADVELGDRAYCYSDPLNRRGYFSDGIVNRIYSLNGSQEPAQQRINVSTDWAQGSSGSCVLDDCGNIIGHVARIQTLNSNSYNKAAQTSSGTTLVLHEAIPAQAIMHLIRQTNDAAQ